MMTTPMIEAVQMIAFRFGSSGCLDRSVGGFRLAALMRNHLSYYYSIIKNNAVYIIPL
ncbi:hypothetical protein IJ21_35650 [Paenibacillus sp. 32O-W]|nr:hypothetical protein IJ21_35650 [Paenibacillus sp. 32O-W]